MYMIRGGGTRTIGDWQVAALFLMAHFSLSAFAVSCAVIPKYLLLLYVNYIYD